MYLNHLPRTQWKYLQYLLRVRQLQLLRRHVNIGAKPPIQTAALLPALGQKLRKHSQLVNGDLQDKFGVPREQDALLTRLEEAKTGNQILDVLESCDGLQSSHVVMGISLLWNIYHDAEQASKDAITDRVLLNVLPKLAPYVHQLEIDDLSRCYLYLRKMHIPNSEAVVEAVLTRSLQLIESQVDDEVIP